MGSWLKKERNHGFSDYRPGRSSSQKVVPRSRARRSTAHGKVSRPRRADGSTFAYPMYSRWIEECERASPGCILLTCRMGHALDFMTLCSEGLVGAEGSQDGPLFALQRKVLGETASADLEGTHILEARSKSRATFSVTRLICFIWLAFSPSPGSGGKIPNGHSPSQ